jgi:tetratricopeptide (TPR) repeat protein
MNVAGIRGQMTTTRLFLLVSAAFLAGCAQARPVSGSIDGMVAVTGSVEAVSLLGDSLRPPPMSAEVRERHEANLAVARAALDRAPRDADSIIWYGRRLAYLGRYRDAIATFSRGIEIHPGDARMYRHRGHRWITVRDFERAIADLSRAAELARGTADEIEPDGIPNALGQPIGTLKSNIYYHLALAHYLKGDFEAAVPVWTMELDSATNDDRRVSTAYWLYLSLKRSGRHAEALGVLDGISPQMNVIENDDYHQMLLTYKGLVEPETLAPAIVGFPTQVSEVTRLYGLAMLHLFSGRSEEAQRTVDYIVRGPQWPAFGYIAAEAYKADKAKGPERARDGR